jgi:hypothetical protein
MLTEQEEIFEKQALLIALCSADFDKHPVPLVDCFFVFRNSDGNLWVSIVGSSFGGEFLFMTCPIADESILFSAG